MNMNQFTLKSQEALEAAQNLAAEYSHPQIETEHLLLALIRQEDGLSRNILAKLEANPDMIEQMEGYFIEFGFKRHSKRDPGNLHFEKYW